MFSCWRNPQAHRPNPPHPSLTPTPRPRHHRAIARIARPAICRCCAGCRPPGRKARDDHHAADAHTSEPIAPLRRSVAGSSALARRHPRIIGNPPTPATAAANRLASASHHHPHAALQPTDCLILLPQRLPAAVETSIARPTTPPSALSHTRSFNRACAPVRGAQTLIRFNRACAPVRGAQTLIRCVHSTEPARPYGARKL